MEALILQRVSETEPKDKFMWSILAFVISSNSDLLFRTPEILLIEAFISFKETLFNENDLIHESLEYKTVEKLP